MYKLLWHIPKKGRKYVKKKDNLKRRRIRVATSAAAAAAATERQAPMAPPELSPQLPRLANLPTPLSVPPRSLVRPLCAFPVAMSILEPSEWQHFSSGYVQTLQHRSGGKDNTHTHTHTYRGYAYTEGTHTAATHASPCHTHSLALIVARVGLAALPYTYMLLYRARIPPEQRMISQQG